MELESGLSLRTRRYRSILDAGAGLSGLPTWRYHDHLFPGGVWLEGLVLAESGGRAEAVRYERHLDRPSPADGDTPDVDDGTREDDRSYGLMQILGSNIREMVGVPKGTPMDFSWALLPMVNIALGLRFLHQLLGQVAYEIPRGLARYNGGGTGDRLGPDGRMRRQEYVDRVFQHSKLVEADRRAAA